MASLWPAVAKIAQGKSNKMRHTILKSMRRPPYVKRSLSLCCTKEQQCLEVVSKIELYRFDVNPQILRASLTWTDFLIFGQEICDLRPAGLDNI